MMGIPGYPAVRGADGTPVYLVAKTGMSLVEFTVDKAKLAICLLAN